MRKAQFEILGLAIIVVIVSIAVFFFLSFYLQPSDNLARQFQEEQYVQNMLTSWLDTSVQDCNETVKHYVTDFVRTGESVGCGDVDHLAQVLNDTMEQYPRIIRWNLSIREGTCPTATRIEEGLGGCQQLKTWGNCNPRINTEGNVRPGRQVLPLAPAHGYAEVALIGCEFS